MAGPETTHKIVEKMEIQGVNEAFKAFDKMAQTLGKTGAQLSKASEQLQKVRENSKKIPKPPAEQLTFWQKAKRHILGADGGLKQFGQSMLGQVTLANLLTKAITGVLQKIREFIAAGWQINVAYEAAQSRIQGVVQSLTNFEKVGVPAAERVQTSIRTARVVMEKFRRTALETATPINVIERGYAAMAPAILGVGKSQAELLKLTQKTAAAAKVFGFDINAVGNSIAKAVQSGTVELEGFGLTLRTQLGMSAEAFKKLSVDARLEKMNQIIGKMGSAVREVTADTAGALSRWKILSMDILQRVTFPIYQKIGQVVGSIVRYFERNEELVNAVVHEAQELWHTTFEVANAIWEVVSGLVRATAFTQNLGAKFSYVTKVAKVWLKVVDAVAFSFRVVAEGVRVLIDPSRGMGKLNALAESFKLKWLEIVRAINKAVSAFARVVVPDWLAKRVPGAKAFLDSLKATNDYLDNRIMRMGEKTRKMEKAAGLGPLTETTRIIEGRGLEKDAAAKLLEKMAGKGLDFNQNIEKVEIRQDFRDQDPDRVMVEFVQDLERLSEAALQSSAGGRATVFGGGGTQ